MLLPPTLQRCFPDTVFSGVFLILFCVYFHFHFQWRRSCGETSNCHFLCGRSSQHKIGQQGFLLVFELKQQSLYLNCPTDYVTMPPTMPHLKTVSSMKYYFATHYPEVHLHHLASPGHTLLPWLMLKVTLLFCCYSFLRVSYIRVHMKYMIGL